MVVLYILLGLIALIVLLLLTPVVLHVTYDGRTPVIRVKYLFVSFNVYPRKQDEPGKLRSYLAQVLTKLKEKQKERKKQRRSASESKQKSPKKSTWQTLREQRGFFGAIAYLLRIVRESASLGAYILRRSVITRLRLHVSIGGDDAAQIGMTQGQWCAAVYPAVSLVICAVKRYSNCDVRILPDFLSQENRYDIDLRLRVRPFHGLSGALRMLISLAKAEIDDRPAADTLEAVRYASGKSEKE